VFSLYEIFKLFYEKRFKNRFLNFFHNLMRVHKEMVGIFLGIKKYKDDELEKLFRYLEFPLVFKTVARLVSVNVELRYNRSRRTQIAVPTIRAPWKALRLGLSLLLATAREKIISPSFNRETGLLYNLWSEIWNTYQRRSITATKSVKYVDEVIREIHSYKLSKLFPMRRDRRRVFRVESSRTIFKEKLSIDKYIHGVFRIKMLKNLKKRVYYDIFKIRRKVKKIRSGRIKKNLTYRRFKFERLKRKYKFKVEKEKNRYKVESKKKFLKVKKNLCDINSKCPKVRKLFKEVLRKYTKKVK